MHFAYSYSPYEYSSSVNHWFQNLYPCPRTYNYHGYFDPIPQRQYFEKVDVTIFNESLKAYRLLLRDASLVLNKLAESKTLAEQVMGAAQLSDTKEVERLIQSLGISSNFKVTYNPDGIHLKFWSEVQGTECCQLDMAIRWG
ncbi:hypothetical protein [Calidifontibacillus erzurumensis]|uniref:Uncharacterized protein n=1 Tax=Calidifontibacillus erzurumensis TaxID=2741433 RepID=A0A8J8GDY1_9BACI|nr:hypothetical protein [Calidifontibacillus erzurumensis]NSL50628.1 hypothetical protein [Calidifontibacillus erzurumensis]